MFFKRNVIFLVKIYSVTSLNCPYRQQSITIVYLLFVFCCIDIVGHLQVLIYHEKQNHDMYGITFYEHNHIFRVYTFKTYIIHRLHDEELHTYRTKATRFKYNCFKYLLTTLERAEIWDFGKINYFIHISLVNIVRTNHNVNKCLYFCVPFVYYVFIFNKLNMYYHL